MELKINPEFKNLIPTLTEEEYAGLQESIMEEGCRESLIVWGETIIDGHNRYEICQKHNIEFSINEKLFEDDNHVKIWIIRNQFARRNLSAYDRSLLAIELEKFIKPLAKEQQGTRTDLCQNSDKSIKPIDTKKEVAKIAGVSHDTIAKVKKIEEKATPEQKERIRKGESINKIHNEITVHVGQNSGENEWYTPPEFIEAARKTMSAIDLDPASNKIANDTVKATKYYTKEQDGLSQKWYGKVWMNPPYAQPLIKEFSTAVMEKYKNSEIEEACILINNATETKWFQGMLEVCSAICLIQGRIKFIDISGNPSGAPLQGQAVIYLGKNTHKFTDNFSQFGVILYNELSAKS